MSCLQLRKDCKNKNKKSNFGILVNRMLNRTQSIKGLREIRERTPLFLLFLANAGLLPVDHRRNIIYYHEDSIWQGNKRGLDVGVSLFEDKQNARTHSRVQTHTSALARIYAHTQVSMHAYNGSTEPADDVNHSLIMLVTASVTISF